MHHPNQKQIKFRSYASVTLQSIFDDCRRNEKPDIYPTSYKPLLLQSTHNFRRNTCNPYSHSQRKGKGKQRMNVSAVNFVTKSEVGAKGGNGDGGRSSKPKSVQSFRYNHHPNSQPTRKMRHTVRTPSQTTRNLTQTFSSPPYPTNPIQSFLHKLYFSKTQDLSIPPNQKQQKIFITRLARTITPTQFIAPQCDFGLNALNTIINFIMQHEKEIEKLVLDRNPIGDEGLGRLGGVVGGLRLRELSLVSVNVTSRSVLGVFRELVGNRWLEVLNLSSPEGLNRNRINPEGFAQIKQLLGHPLCNIHTLNLSNTGMGQKGFLSFCSTFSTNPPPTPYKSLNLSHNEISLSQPTYPYLSTCLSNLTVSKLQLQHNNLSELGAKMLAHVVGAQYGRSLISGALEYLDISANGVRSWGFQELCNLLPSNRKILEVVFDGNDLGDKEVFYCVKHLLTYTWSIKKLSLRNTLPGAPETTYHHLKSMSQGLFHNKSLKQLDISYNTLSPQAFSDIFQSLKQNQTLKILKMQGCGIQDSFLQKAQELIKENRSLFCINFCNNFINQKGAQVLLKILETAHNVTEVNLKKNCVNLHLLNDVCYQLRENKAMVRPDDPEYMYINYIMGLQQQQKKTILTAINELDTKTNYLAARGVALSILQKQQKIMKKQEEIKAETGKISKLQQELEKEREKEKEMGKGRRRNVGVIDGSSFLVTN